MERMPALTRAETLFHSVHTEGSVFGTLFHRKLRILLLCNNLRIKSNIGTMKAATADFAGSIFLGSAFYSFYSFTPFLI